MRDDTRESQRPRTPPWHLEELTPKEIVAELRATETWVQRLRGLWGRQVPACWYLHQDLGLALIAARNEWDLRVGKEGGRSVYTFLGDELERFVLAPMAKPIGDGESKHRIPGSEAHRAVSTRDIGGLDGFLESPWFRWVWCGVTPPPRQEHADA